MSEETVLSFRSSVDGSSTACRSELCLARSFCKSMAISHMAHAVRAACISLSVPVARRSSANVAALRETVSSISPCRCSPIDIIRSAMRSLWRSIVACGACIYSQYAAKSDGAHAIGASGQTCASSALSPETKRTDKTRSSASNRRANCATESPRQSALIPTAIAALNGLLSPLSLSPNRRLASSTAGLSYSHSTTTGIRSTCRTTMSGLAALSARTLARSASARQSRPAPLSHCAIA